MIKIINFILRPILIIFGLVLLINPIVLLFTTNYNAGLTATLLVGLVLISYGIFFKIINKLLPKWLKTIAIIIIAIAVVCVGFLHIYGAKDNVTYKEDAIIVLGAAVKDDLPSATLKARLDVAVEYHHQNPEAVIVVSGGQGPDEDVSEAVAMETYLISKGISKEKIIKEDTSTSTHQNFHNSKKILDGYFNKHYTVAYVTNEYHIFRAGSVAKSVGFESTTHIHCSTRWYLIVPGTLRECMAIVKYWLLNN